MAIIVTTGNIKENHSIIQPVFVQISNKGVLKNQYEQLEIKHQKLIQGLQDKELLPPNPSSKKRNSLSSSMESTDITGVRMEKAFYIALEEIKQKAAHLEGDAVVYMRYETDFLANPSNEFYLQMYGTVVKFEAE